MDLGVVPFSVILFILFVALPAFGLTFLGLKFSKVSKKDNSYLVVFPLMLIILAVLANFLWDQFIFKKIYYEWDRIMIPYTFGYYEFASPLVYKGSVSQGPNWFAPGWNQRNFALFWYAITEVIYLIGGIIAIFISGYKNLKLMYWTVGLMSLFSFIFFFAPFYIYFIMKRKWFRAKNYGWGWVPVTWEGWLVTFGFCFLEVANFFRIDSHSHSASDTLINFIPETLVLVAVLIVICYVTGEKPEWRWGKKKL